MNWDTFFDVGESVTAEETRQFMESGEPDRYQLIDVRQPGEYEQGHIPGAILMPLPELLAKSADIEPDKPVIAYCRTGTRSKAACQLLSRIGVKYVFNMTGGFLTWQGMKLEGDVETGLEYFADGDFATTFEMAYQMEMGLKQFYMALADKAADDQAKETLNKLGRFEDSHMAKLKARYDAVPEYDDMTVMEGGFEVDDMLAAFSNQINSQEEVLQLGLKLETQAFDLYSRLAWKHQGEDTATFFQEMAEEEQEHLRIISGELDKLIARA